MSFIAINFLNYRVNLFCLLIFASIGKIQAQHNYNVNIVGDVNYCNGAMQKVYSVAGLNNPVWNVFGGTIVSYPSFSEVLVEWTLPYGSISVQDVYEYTVCEDICITEYECYQQCNTITDTYSGYLEVSLLQSTFQIEPSATACSNTPIVLSTNQIGTTIQWKKNGASIVGANQNSYTIQESGQYTLQISLNGCVSEAVPVSLSILPMPSIPILNATISQSAPGATHLQASNGNSYVWYKNNNKISNASSSNVFQATTAGTYKVENTNGVCGTFSLPVEVFDNSPYPSVVINKIKQANILDETQINSLANLPSIINQEVQYLNKQGQTIEKIQRSASPLGKDILKVYEYDPYGRSNKSFLPIVVNQNSGLYVPDVTKDTNGLYTNSQHYNFFNNASLDPTQTIPDDTQPFSVAVLEKSPLNRVIEQGEVGNGFQPLDNISNTPTIRFSFGTNTSSEVLQFTIQEFGADFFIITKGLYPSNTLNKKVTKTPKQAEVIEFTNNSGKTVVRKIQIDSTKWAETYYVYDIKDNLRFVLTPELNKYIQENNLTSISSEQPLNLLTTNTSLTTSTNAKVYPYQNGVSVTLAPGFTSANGFLVKPLGNTTYTINRYAYQFKYDHRNRKIAEKAPGADWSYFIYDNLDRLILKQPPHLRASNQWAFTKYDRFQRVILTGLVTINQSIDEIRNIVKNHTILYEEPSTVNAIHGYTNIAFPNQPDVNLYNTVIYYDNYSFTSLFPNNINWSYQYNALENMPSNANTRIKGSITGTKLRILNTNDWLFALSYYDENDRIIQSISTNHIGGTDINCTVYDFTGKVIASRLIHNNGQQQFIITEDFEYDAAGRILRHFHQLGSNLLDRVLLEEFAYNELGDLETHKLHRKADLSFLQNIQYRSNIRGQILSQISEDYQQTMGYNQTQTLPSVNLSYSGEITSIVTTHKIKETDKQYAWTFDYDKLSQLTGSEQWERDFGTSLWVQPSNQIKESNFTYDLNGNIQSLLRSSRNGTIDDLQYNYGIGNNQSNQLLSITDVSLNNEGFKDENTSGNDYNYDAAGNLVQDLNKNISSITYNEINRPQQITVSGVGYLTYLYSADGTKLADMLYSHTNQLLKRTDYATPFIYEQDFTQGNQRKLHSIQTAAGRILPIPTGGYEYQYILTDHLGSARTILSASPRTYTYKATMENSNSTAEEMLFTNVAETRVEAPLSTINQTPGGSKVVALNALKPIGPTLSLQVFPQDKVNANVYIHHSGSNYGTNRIALSNLVTALVSSFGGSSLSNSEATSLSNELDDHFSSIGLLPGPENNLPAAYLNYILFDINMEVLTMGYKRVGTTPGIVSLDEITITEPGYIYLYLSNEGSLNENVYFDDFTVTLNESKLCGVYHNYPYGTSIAELGLERWRMPTNQKRFQGKQYEDALGINFYDFQARYYNSLEARFNNLDPRNQFASGYVGMGNNPIMGVDPDGEWFISLLKTMSGLGILVNAASAVKESFKGRNLWDGLGILATSFATNTAADYTAISAGGLGLVNSTLGSLVAIAQGDFNDVGKIFRAGVIAPIDADIATLKMGGLTTIAASGVNSLVASGAGAQVTWNRAVGDDSRSYEGRIDIGDDGAQALLWFARNRNDVNATVRGNGITLKRKYFNQSSNFVKASILYHESIHVRQQKLYGTGGQFSRYMKKYDDPNPDIDCDDTRTEPCGPIERAFESYNGKPINLLEVEAENYQIDYLLSLPLKYQWTAIPIFR